MNDFTVDPRAAVSPSRQILERALDAIAAGEIGAGERLPRVRAFAAQVLVNPNTVSKAYRELEGMGIVESRNGSGVFVTEDGPALARRRRSDATLSALRAAAVTALRAGHDPETIMQTVSQAANARPVPEGELK